MEIKFKKSVEVDRRLHSLTHPYPICTARMLIKTVESFHFDSFAHHFIPLARTASQPDALIAPPSGLAMNPYLQAGGEIIRSMGNSFWALF